jgi:hypothetical protein
MPNAAAMASISANAGPPASTQQPDSTGNPIGRSVPITMNSAHNSLICLFERQSKKPQAVGNWSARTNLADAQKKPAGLPQMAEPLPAVGAVDPLTDGGDSRTARAHLRQAAADEPSPRTRFAALV